MEKQLNLTRQVPLDLARGLSVLFMVLIHVQEYFLNHSIAEPQLEAVVDFLGGIPAAPVFMFLMGVGWVYSRRSTPEVLLKRGLGLIGTGYLLSILRGVLPNLLHLSVGGGPFFLGQGLQQLAFVDILQFSGLAMMAFALMKYFNLGPRAIAGIALALVALNGVLAYGLGAVSFEEVLIPLGTQYQTIAAGTGQLILEHLIGLLIGYNGLSFFPFLTWMVYPLIGYLFGYFLVRVSNQSRFYTLCGLTGAAIFFGATFVVDYILEWDNLLYSASAYYHHQGVENLIATGFILFFIGICFWIGRLLPKWLERPITRWSANVTDIYFIHWVIIGWLSAFMGYGTLSTPYYAALVVLIFWISDRMSVKLSH